MDLSRKRNKYFLYFNKKSLIVLIKAETVLILMSDSFNFISI